MMNVASWCCLAGGYFAAEVLQCWVCFQDSYMESSVPGACCSSGPTQFGMEILAPLMRLSVEVIGLEELESY